MWTGQFVRGWPGIQQPREVRSKRDSKIYIVFGKHSSIRPSYTWLIVNVDNCFNTVIPIPWTHFEIPLPPPSLDTWTNFKIRPPSPWTRGQILKYVSPLLGHVDKF